MPVEVRRNTGSTTVGIQKDGTLSLSRGVCNRLGYKPGDSILFYYIDKGPLLILLKKVQAEPDTFRLSYLYKSSSGESGCKIRSKPFYDEVLKPRVRLPKVHLKPIIPNNWIYDVGVFIEDIDWQRAEFSRNGRETIDKNRIAVYRLISSREKILRFGEGNLLDRFADHLGDTTLVKEVSFIEWAYVRDKEDAQIIQRLLLEQYINQYGVLPELNDRRF